MSSLLIRGFVLGFVVAASPGPIFFLCFGRTLARGWLNGLVSGFGVATADGFYSALAAFGIGAIASLLAGERRGLSLIGGAVLMLLGLRAVLQRSNAEGAAQPSNGAGLVWAYLSTLGLTLANPSTIVSFAALVASLGIGISGGYLPPTLLVLGVFAGSATWWCLLAGLGTGLRSRVTPRVVRGINTVSGLGIAALGLAAIVSILV